MKASDKVESLGHLLWGTCPREGAGLVGPSGALQEDAPCPSSGAGLVSKWKLNLIHSWCSFKMKAAFDAEDADATSLSTASSLHINNTALKLPLQRAVLPWLSLTHAARHSAANNVRAYHVPQFHRGFSPSSIMIFNSRWLRGCFGGVMGTTLPLLRAPALGLPLAERVRMTFPKGKKSPWGYPGIEGGLHSPQAPPVPHGFTPPSLWCEGCKSPAHPNPCPAGMDFFNWIVTNI